MLHGIQLYFVQSTYVQPSYFQRPFVHRYCALAQQFSIVQCSVCSTLGYFQWVWCLRCLQHIICHICYAFEFFTGFLNVCLYLCVQCVHYVHTNSIAWDNLKPLIHYWCDITIKVRAPNAVMLSGAADSTLATFEVKYYRWTWSSLLCVEQKRGLNR
jgi:hypothetical protein